MYGTDSKVIAVTVPVFLKRILYCSRIPSYCRAPKNVSRRRTSWERGALAQLGDTVDGREILSRKSAQVAAALSGFGEQVGYARLVKEICDVELSKAYTRTAWCRRPLNDEEIRYALDDAHYLGDLYQHLKILLQQRGRAAWATEDFTFFGRPKTRSNIPIKKGYSAG